MAFTLGRGNLAPLLMPLQISPYAQNALELRENLQAVSLFSYFIPSSNPTTTLYTFILCKE